MWLLRRLRRQDAVSARWLAEHARRGDRVEFHGVAWRWPVAKDRNERGWANRRATRRSA